MKGFELQTHSLSICVEMLKTQLLMNKYFLKGLNP